jgi:oxygen-independent coproporphyrinogen-3 oxidase
MDPHLIPYAERQAPRYTSYPSANHFDAAVDAQIYRRWLGSIGERATLSLYLHIPYCRQLCWYCGCNTFLTRGGDSGDFVTSMMTEIDLVASALGSRNVDEVHWGGGTPNVLSAAEFLRLVHHIDFWFDILPGARHAIELDPRHVTAELATPMPPRASAVCRSAFRFECARSRGDQARATVRASPRRRQNTCAMRGSTSLALTSSMACRCRPART